MTCMKSYNKNKADYKRKVNRHSKTAMTPSNTGETKVVAGHHIKNNSMKEALLKLKL